MSTQQQIDQNIVLSLRLADYLVKNPEIIKNTPADASYVIFSYKFPKLNEVNSEMLDKMVESGEPVIKVEEIKNQKNPWNFTLLSI